VECICFALVSCTNPKLLKGSDERNHKNIQSVQPPGLNRDVLNSSVTIIHVDKELHTDVS
jgi:hypothetical protein